MIAIYFSFRKEKRKVANIKILHSLLSRYRSLINTITYSYDLKTCSNCYKNLMELLTVSPTGQSIEYKCVHCSEILTCEILPGKEGSEVAGQYNEIKDLLKSLRGALDEILLQEVIDNTFTVNTYSGYSRES